MNEWVTVRMRERAIYTTGRKVCSDYVESLNIEPGTSDTH